MMQWVVIVHAGPSFFPPDGVHRPRLVDQRGKTAIERIALAPRRRADRNRPRRSLPRPVESRPVKCDRDDTRGGPLTGDLRGTCRSSVGTPGPGSSPRLRHRSANRDVRAAPRPARLVAPARPPPGRPPDVSDCESHWERSRILNRREVGRGWDASAADARQGPPGVVRTTPAAAVRPLPGIRRQAPRRGYAPTAGSRARFSRMSERTTPRPTIHP